MKGMQKIKRGSGFEGVLSYAFERDTPFAEKGLLVGGNMSGTTIEELTREFGVSHSLRPDVEKPVWHNSLRLPPGDTLGHDVWWQIAKNYVEEMGFKPSNPYVAILHDDAEGQHIHIIASRVGFDKSLYLGQNENLISTRIIQSLEPKYGLTITKGLEYDENNRIVTHASKSRPSKGEVEQANRTGEAPVRLRLQAIVDAATKGKPSVVAFIERLEVQGVTVLPNLASTGKLNGFSFELDGIAFKGSQLGAAYSWSKLQKSGVGYEQDRDYAELSKRRAQASGQISPERQPDAERSASVSAGIEPVATVDSGVVVAIESAVSRDDSTISVAHEPVEVDAVTVSSVTYSSASASDAGDQRRVADEYATVDGFEAGFGQTTSGVGESINATIRAAESRDTSNQRIESRRSERSSESSARSDFETDSATNSRVDSENQRHFDRGSVTSELSIGNRSEQSEAAITRHDQEAKFGNSTSEKASTSSTSEAGATVGIDKESLSRSSVGNSGSNGRVDWALRFKQTSANAKRSANDVEQGDRERARIYAKDSKSVSPIPFLESRGFVVKKVGSSFSIRLNGDEYYRLDNTRSGWLWCDQYGNRGGDNIDLVKEIDGSHVAFIDAVYSLGITDRGYAAPVTVAPVADRHCEFEPVEDEMAAPKILLKVEQED